MTPFERARAELKALGVTLKQAPGEYHVGFSNGLIDIRYDAEDLDRAVAEGKLMAKHWVKNATPPPLGPMGAGSGRKAKMYRHNRKVAARQQKNKEGKIEAEITGNVKRR